MRSALAATAFVLMTVSAPVLADNLTLDFKKFPVAVDQAVRPFRPFDDATTTFRTKFREGFERGVAFGGHYVIAGWGCGTGCSTSTIMDARTGKYAQFSAPAGTAVECRPDSNLIGFYESREDTGDKGRTTYYVFKKGHFTKLGTVPDGD